MQIKLMGCSICLGLTVFVSACAGERVLVSTNAKSVASLAVTKSAVGSADGFTRLASDGRIAYEVGGEGLALDVARYIDAKAAIIEQRQYAPFSKSIYVYVLNSEESAKRYCAILRARGCVVNQRLYIAPRAKSTLPSLIQHELSHLHFEQKLGMYRYHSRVPAWFQEGLAVFVSDGAGAEKAPFTKVINALRSGKSIKPNDTRSLRFPKKAAQFGLKNSMFYAQSGVFVSYLYQQSPAKFKRFVLSLAAGNRFAPTFGAVYGQSLNEVWLVFNNEVRNNDLASLNRYRLR